jgi:hypothetical membrane protein
MSVNKNESCQSFLTNELAGTPVQIKKYSTLRKNLKVSPLFVLPDICKQFGRQNQTTISAMSPINNFKKKLSDPFFTFTYFERIIAIFCISIPLILWLTDGGIPHSFRRSISNYAYMSHSYVFGMLLCIAAMLFIFNGAVYYKNEPTMNISWHGQWYNVVLGLALIGTICFPHQEHPIEHYIFAAIFFVGNALVTGIFYKDKDKVASIIMAILTVLTIPLAFFMNVISILVAEWISLCVIAIHFILSTKKMDQPVNIDKPKRLTSLTTKAPAVLN